MPTKHSKYIKGLIERLAPLLYVQHGTNTFFGYPPNIRKAICTTNAIKSLNSVIRTAIKKRNVFPTDDSVRKVIYLAGD